MDLELLKKPFPTEQIKQRQTSIGMTVSYLETPTIINRLNDVFDGEWSFQIIDHKFLDDDVVVLGELTAGGVSKQQFGTCELHQETEDGLVLSMGDALKAAASDALKKTATLFGIGLQLYGVPVEESFEKETPPEETAPDPEPVAVAAPTEESVVEAEESVEPAPVEDDLDDLLGEAPDVSDRVTDLQLAEIIDLAQKRKFNKDQVDQRARSRYGRGLAEITQTEALEIIEKLKGA